MSSQPYARSAHASLDGLVMGDAFGDSWFTLSGEDVEEQWAARGLRPTPWQWTDDSAMACVRGDPKEAAGQARLSALATHAHPEAVAGAVAVAVAAALAAASTGHDAPARAEFLREVAGYVPGSEVGSGLRMAAELPAGTPVGRAASVLGSGWRISAPDTVPFALWCAAGHVDDLAEALWQTVGGWGDRDTTCAIAGGVVAARTGTGGVPADWLAAREAVPAWSGWAPEPPAP